jgi:hypothetical protein
MTDLHYFANELGIDFEICGDWINPSMFGRAAK